MAKTKYKLAHWTCEQAGAEWGCDKETVSAALKREGIEPAFDDGKFSTRQIDSALHGDIDSERKRKITAEADILEIERAEKRRVLVESSKFLEVAQRGLQAMVASVMGMTELKIEQREKIIEQLRECGKSVAEVAGDSNAPA